MNTWYSGNRFLDITEMRHNARNVSEILGRHGFSLNAIAGILANMEAESTINPGIWEGLFPYNGGYGLVQWTPYTKYSQWVMYDWQDNGDKECERINYEFNNGIQFYASREYPITAQEFKVSTQTPEYLAGAFMHNYERPASYATQKYRQDRARYWFDYLQCEPTPEPEPEPEPPIKRRKNLWLFTPLSSTGIKETNS